MTLAQGFIIAAIAALVLVAVLHSVFGEKLLLRPMFKRRGNPVLENKLARNVLRFAWHLTSVLWLMIAIILYSTAFSPNNLNVVVLSTIGAGFLFVGIFDLIVSKGRHIGWPVLSAIGVFCLAALSLEGITS